MQGHRVELRFPGTLAGFDEAFSTLLAELRADRIDPRSRFNVEVVFEEIVSNLVRHAAPHVGTLDVEVSVDLGANPIVMTFVDNGPAFDPAHRPDPMPPTSLSDAPDGGFGLMLVRRATTSTQYERMTDRRNRLVVAIAATPLATSAQAGS